MLKSIVDQKVISDNPMESGTVPARLNVESTYETCSIHLPLPAQSTIKKIHFNQFHVPCCHGIYSTFCQGVRNSFETESTSNCI